MDRSGTLLYDGDCGLCTVTAGWLSRRVPASELGLLALQDVDSEPDVASAVQGRDLREQLHFVRDDGEVLTGARAALAAGRLVPVLGWYAVAADHPLGHALLEPLYREIASHRRRLGRLLGLPDACPIVTRRRDR